MVALEVRLKRITTRSFVSWTAPVGNIRIDIENAGGASAQVLIHGSLAVLVLGAVTAETHPRFRATLGGIFPMFDGTSDSYK